MLILVLVVVLVIKNNLDCWPLLLMSVCVI